MTKQEIFYYLNEQVGNVYGTAGLMGNLKAESNLNPMNLQNSFEKKLGYNDESYTAAVDSGKYQNFARDSAGYGLAQWTYWSRKQALLNYARSHNKSIGDIEMQLDFLLYELQKNYSGVWNVLKNAMSVQEASDKVLTGFEKPANQGEAVKKARAALGKTILKEVVDAKTINETTDEYYPVPGYTGNSIIDALKSIGVDSCKANRAKIAVKNGVVKTETEFKGTAAQNKQLLALLKAGQLKRV